MDKLLYLAGPLSCAVGMGICMAMMGRRSRSKPDAAAAAPDEVAALRAELAELRAEQASHRVDG